MKRIVRAMALAAFCICLASSCNMMGDPEEGNGVGELRISFSETGGLVTRSELEVPDTNDFIITVTDPEGDVIYDGAYGDCPECIMVDAGSYIISVRSCEFTKPAFSKPQFGDEQCVVVPSGGVADVKLTCSLMNSGVRLDVDSSFLDEYPDGVLFLKSSQGKLMYGYSEKRTAYFFPGSVSLMLSESGADQILMTRILSARDMLTISVSAASRSSEESIRVAVDTSRTWLYEDYVIGGGSDDDNGDDVSSSITVSQARDSAGEEDVWVCGYIVGGDLSSSSASFCAPFSSRTNLLLGPKSSTKDKDACLSVQLLSGDIRDALNLVDNQSLLGRKIYLKGDIVTAYYGIPGLKNVSDYEL